MKLVNLRNSYFTITNPLSFIERWKHCYRHESQIAFNNKELYIEWTDRAQSQLDQLSQRLIVEMQLYFSCVVIKRVLFHHQSELDAVTVNDQIRVVFRSVQSSVCSPEEFARNYPVARELPAASKKMTPSRLSIDFKRGQWEGEFAYENIYR